MYKKNRGMSLCKLIIPALVLITMAVPDALATSTLKSLFLSAYPSANGTRLVTVPSHANHCGLCHYNFNGGGALNGYGTAVAGRSADTAAAILALGSLDSDGDSFTNAEEIEGTGFTNVPTFPGLTSSNVSQTSNVTVSQIIDFLTPAVATPTGNVRVTLGPTAAVVAGAQWAVDGGALHNSGTTVTGLSVGSHTVSYKAIGSPWTAPSSETVSISDGNTASITSNYTITPHRTVLVYKTALAINPAAFRNDPNVGWSTGNISPKGWAVIDVNLADPNVANIKSFLVPFGKGPDANGVVKKVYVNDATLTISKFLILSGLQTAPTKFKPDVFLFDFTANNVAAERVGLGIVDARMQGTTVATQTLPGLKENIAKLLKGVAIDDSLHSDVLAGCGTFVATLDPKFTTQANDPAVYAGDSAAVVAAIKAKLATQGYVTVTQTP